VAPRPSVSVVIPTFNRARYLREAVESMLVQVGAADEVIVVDDGSTDETPELLATYGDRVRVVRTSNGGLGAARNVGIAAARNTWVAFHDSDDVARANRLALRREWVVRRPDLDAVLCNGEHLDGPGIWVVPAPVARRHRGRLVGVRALFDGFPLYLQGALVRRSAFAAAGAFDSALRIHADLDYGYRLLHVARAIFIDQPVFSYRWHGTNITADRLAGRQEIARILAGLLEGAPQICEAIGRRRIRVRLARHYVRLARTFVAAGRSIDADGAAALAKRLRPLRPRYRSFRSGSRASVPSVG